MICAQCVVGLCLHCALAFGRCGKLLWSVLCSCARFVLVLCFGVRALWLAVVVGFCSRVLGFVLVLWFGGRALWLLLWLVVRSCAWLCACFVAWRSGVVVAVVVGFLALCLAVGRCG